MGYQLGVDIGGTFTDLFAVDEETGQIVQEKVPTTPEDFSRGFIEAIEHAVDRHGIARGDITHLSHGTTVATNAMLEREGVPTGVIATAGFRDVTAIGREDRANVYDLSPSKIPTFTERRHRIGVTERMSADGEVVTPLDETGVRAAADTLAESDIESVAVALLHAYRNDAHERRIKEIVTDRTDLTVSLSSEVMPEIKEYERTLSTVIDAYVGPIVNEYVERLEARLADVGVEATLHLMQANGGVITPRNLERQRLRLINSGPAAGVIGAKRAAETVGIESVLTLDMGGTSADACAVRGGIIETTTEGELDDFPLLFPQVDVRTIGAGGGSIAWLDPADVLKVGPKSAGAEPGPACYGRGGERPTVTDAALALGYLNPEYFLGGEMTLDTERAEAALAPLCETLDRDLVEVADGILDIATTNLTQAIRLVTVEKGYDPRDFTLTCYGGAGPLFTTRLARSLDLERALIPAAPGVLSARGLLNADKRFSFSRSHIRPFETGAVDDIAVIYDELETEAESEGVVTPDARLERAVDLRYEGQTSQLTIDLPAGTVDTETMVVGQNQFHEQHESIYGHSNPSERIEGVTWRLRVVEETPSVPEPTLAADGTATDAVKGTRDAYADGRFREFTVYDRYGLSAGATFEGPAIIEEAESTAVLGSDTTIEVAESGSLIVEL